MTAVSYSWQRDACPSSDSGSATVKVARAHEKGGEFPQFAGGDDCGKLNCNKTAYGNYKRSAIGNQPARLQTLNAER